MISAVHPQLVIVGNSWQSILIAPQIVLQQWRGLVSRDPGPVDCQLLKTLVESRYIVPELKGRDVTTIVNIIDEAGPVLEF